MRDMGVRGVLHPLYAASEPGAVGYVDCGCLFAGAGEFTDAFAGLAATSLAIGK
jgi:hypothetical protein